VIPNFGYGLTEDGNVKDLGLKKIDLLVIGGGAGGFFGAIRYAEQHPGAKVVICEKKSRFLEKVLVSGGGRCNVTHDWSKPEDANLFYPRGADFLQTAFSEFHCSHMRKWLADNGVPTKVEDDGRVFPSSNKSSSIIQAFLDACAELEIDLQTNSPLLSMVKQGDYWISETGAGLYESPCVLFATGSNRPVWDILKGMGHSIAAPVASLFAFNVSSGNWKNLAGISVLNAEISLDKFDFKSNGPLLITHKGLSGPAVLKLSAWAARELEKRNYHFEVIVNWVGISKKECLKNLKILRDEIPKKNPRHINPYELPKRLNQHLMDQTDIKSIKMAELGNKSLELWADALCASKMVIEGKATNKDEFVTCGGVILEEVDSSSMQSNILPGLYFAGEILNIDAITGGFNFQACWSGANLAAMHMPTE
jgi:predicted Rossmann fold flavoprotein